MPTRGLRSSRSVIAAIARSAPPSARAANNGTGRAPRTTAIGYAAEIATMARATRAATAIGTIQRTAEGARARVAIRGSVVPPRSGRPHDSIAGWKPAQGDEAYHLEGSETTR